MEKSVGTMIDTSVEFIGWLREHESDLMERILKYAKEYGYTKYTSTLLEAWRISIVGLTDSLELLMQEYPTPPPMGPDESFCDDPASKFGLMEAQRHRSRGVNYAMFISLFKYYGQTYHDLIEEHHTLFRRRSYFDDYVKTFFNRVEIAYSIEWHGRKAEDQIHELSEQNLTLANEKNLYLTIFDSIAMGAILLDHEGKILNYNMAASEILTGSYQTSGAYYYGLDKTLLTPDWIRDTLEKKSTHFYHTLEHNGTNRMYDGTVMQMNDISGKFSGYVITLTDMSDYQAMQEKVQKTQELMITQSRHAAMGEMISMIAHQWRQPLGIISMAANNLILNIDLGTSTEEECLASIDTIVSQVQYLSKTIDDFRDFFRPNKNCDFIKIIDIIKETEAMMGASLVNNNITLEINNESTATIETYSRELLQVFINIVKNAKEALIGSKTAHPLIIRINIMEDETSIITTLFNTGDKIPDEVLPKIFDPYFSTKDEKVGTGLGLYISKTIIEKHLMGSISAKNTLDGVCFTIRLPKQERNSRCGT